MKFFTITLCWLLVSLSGCSSFLPEISRQPTVHNPFPQLTRVAVAPFFNLSAEPTVDGRQFALAYFNELQSIPGFEVLPVGVVEKTAEAYQIPLESPADVRRLAQILDVDAIVIGAVTDYSPYYPPRCGLQVEWYAANPGFHPIPPGYGLPWGTAEEEQIPGRLIFEAEHALARAQLKTQSPLYTAEPRTPPPQQYPAEQDPNDQYPPEMLPAPGKELGGQATGPTATGPEAGVKAVAHLGEGKLPGDLAVAVPATEPVHAAVGMNATNAPAVTGLPGAWPDPRGFIPPPPGPVPASAQPTHEPVLRHTRTFNGHDADFTTALESYVYFRDDARFGGWQSYLQRSEDFTRFCCHLHISEMLTARGGAGESRVVWRWPTGR